MDITIDDISPQLNFVSVSNTGNAGYWHNAYELGDANVANFYRQTVSRTTGEGNYVQYEFNASSIKVFGSFFDNHGVYGITLDGGQEAEADAWAPGRVMNAEKASFDNLAAGNAHTLTLTNYPSKNKRPGDARASQGFLDVDYVVLHHDVQGQVRTTRHEQDAPAFTWSGNWETLPRGPEGGFIQSSWLAGASATLNFIGTSVQIFGGLGQEYGLYSVLLDGVEAGRRFNASLPNAITEVPLYTASGLEDGPHTLQIVNQGANGQDAIIDIDYAIVNSTLPQTGQTGAGANSTAANSSTTSASSSTSGSSTSQSSNTATLPTTSSGPARATNTASAGPVFADPANGVSSANSNSDSGPSLAPGAIAGIAVGAAFVLGLIAILIWYLRDRAKQQDAEEKRWANAHGNQMRENHSAYGGLASGSLRSHTNSGYPFAQTQGQGPAATRPLGSPYDAAEYHNNNLHIANPSYTGSPTHSQPHYGPNSDAYGQSVAHPHTDSSSEGSRWSSIFAFGIQRPRTGGSASGVGSNGPPSAVPSSTAMGGSSRWPVPPARDREDQFESRGLSPLREQRESGHQSQSLSQSRSHSQPGSIRSGGRSEADNSEWVRERDERASNPFTYDGMSDVHRPPTGVSRRQPSVDVSADRVERLPMYEETDRYAPGNGNEPATPYTAMMREVDTPKSVRSSGTTFR